MPLFPPAPLNEARCQRYGWLVLLLLTALLYLPGTAVLPLMDRDEPRFAHATVEMIQRGSWAVPYFNGEYRFDKPPLTYWWMALHYKLLGVSEFSARIHTVLAVWLVALVTGSIGKRVHSARAGLLAGAAWIVTLQVIVHGRLCVADMPLVLCVTLAFRALLEVMQEGSRGFQRWHWLLYGSLGLGFLAKGPLALLVPGVALLLMRFAFWRKPLRWKQLCVWPGLLISVGIAGSWGVPALIETQGLFWKVGMGEHVVERGTKAFNGRFPVPGYYLATAFISLFPWIALLPPILTAVRRQWSETNALLVSWFAAPYLIFICYATQLPHYVMPGFPAAMLLLAVGGKLSFTAPWHRWWCLACLGLLLILALVVAALSWRFDWPKPLLPVLQHGAGLLLSLAVMGACLVWLALARSRPAMIGSLLSMIAMAALLQVVCRDVRAIHPAVTVAQRYPALPADTELIGWRFSEPSLVFHLDRQWRFTSKVASVEKRMVRAGPRLIVLLKREWTLKNALQRWLGGKSMTEAGLDLTAEVNAVMARHPDYQCSTFTALNAARSSWVELVVMVRGTDDVTKLSLGQSPG
jgi:4-amino-4-deoxy-L-arabinose transferase-like glycosyltransferase